MGEVSFTFRVDDDLKSAFAEVAKAQDRTSAQLPRLLMRREVGREHETADYDAWFRSEDEQALREADDPAVQRTSNEVIDAEWANERAELVKRAEGRRESNRMAS